MTADRYRQALAQPGLFSHGNAAVYVHLPFCASRCLSCHSNTTVTHDTRAVDNYLQHLDREMDLATRQAGRSRPLAQLHLGGGTPNYLTEPQLMRLMDIVERYFTVNDQTTMSLDASPRRSSYAQLELLRGLGFRDIKFDVRDLDANVQKRPGSLRFALHAAGCLRNGAGDRPGDDWHGPGLRPATPEPCEHRQTA